MDSIAALLDAIATEHAPLRCAILLYLKLANFPLTVLIAFGAVFLALRNSSKKQESRHEAVRRVLVPLAVGCSLWIVQYALDLAMTVRSPPLACPIEGQADSRFLLEQVNSIVNLFVTTAFVAVGAALVQLRDRIHEDLPPPTEHGIEFSAPLRSALGHRRTTWFFLFLGALLVSLFWNNRAKANAVDALLSCVGMTVLGLGFVRELNRNRIDPTGGITAITLLLYAALQLGVLVPPLKVPIYTLSIIFKWVMLMGLTGFFVAGQEAGRAYREAQRDLTNQVLGVLQQRQVARHAIRNALSTQAFLIDEIIEKTPPDLHPLLKDLQVQAEEVEQQTKLLVTLPDTNYTFQYGAMENLLHRVCDDLDKLYGCHVTVGAIEPSDIQVPHGLLRDALHRVVENAAQAGASKVILTANREEFCWSIFIDNNGPIIPQDKQKLLFRSTKGGFWVARRVATNLGGDITLSKTDEHWTRFKMLIPDRQEPQRDE